MKNIKINISYQYSIYFILFFAFLLRILYILVHYNDGWEPDTYNHILFAQSVYADLPNSLSFALGVWQKPLYTIIVATWLELFPSGSDALPLVQFLNALLWLLSSYVILKILKILQFNIKSIVIASIFMSFAYILFRASITANTEIIGMIFFIFGLLYWVMDKKYTALFLFGLLPLVRTDAVFFIYIFPVAYLYEIFTSDSCKNKIIASLKTIILFSLPLLLWNFSGFLETGSPLYLITHGYPGISGIYGYGKTFHYVVEFIKADTSLFVLYWIGVAITIKNWKTVNSVYRILLIATLSYFIIISIMWIYGGFGTAGLLRYFVFAYPGFIIVSLITIEYLIKKVKNNFIVNLVLLGTVLSTFSGLHWLVQKPQAQAQLFTSVPKNNLKILPYILDDYSEMPIYADYPAIFYYLHKNFTESTLKRLDDINDSADGYVFFTKDWTEFYSNFKEERLKKFQKIGEIKSDYLSTVVIYKITGKEK